jgi:hypothetical protein
MDHYRRLPYLIIILLGVTGCASAPKSTSIYDQPIHPSSIYKHEPLINKGYNPIS